MKTRSNQEWLKTVQKVQKIDQNDWIQISNNYNENEMQQSGIDGTYKLYD